MHFRRAGYWEIMEGMVLAQWMYRDIQCHGPFIAAKQRVVDEAWGE
jgi:hypothetical protein